MRFGTWLEDRHAKTLPSFCRQRPKTDRLAPDSFFWAGLASFSREEIQSGGDRSVFCLSRQKFAGGHAICMWRHVQVLVIANKTLIDRQQLENGCSTRQRQPARRRSKNFKSGFDRSFFVADHENLHVPLHAYRAAACKFLLQITKKISIATRSNFLSCFRGESSTKN